MQFNWRFLYFTIVVYIIVNLTGLLVPLVINAAKYAQISREIYDSGKWINLSIAGAPYDQKPPLLFWLGALSFHLFGVSTISFKLPVILYSFIGIYSTYKLGALLYTKKVGQLAAFFWATCIAYFHFHNDIHADTILAANVIWAIWQFAAFFKTKIHYHFLLGVIATGLAMLSKGPIGLMIPVFAVATHLVFHKKYNEIFHFRMLPAVLILTAIISPALIGLFNQFGFEGIKFFFWTNNMGRITGSLQGNNTDLLFYFHNSILTMAPWSGFIIAGIFFEFRDLILKLFRNEKTKATTEYYTLGAIVLYFIVITIAKQKNPHYLMVIIPLAMILAAKWALIIFNGQLYKRTKKAVTIFNYSLTIIVWPAVLLFTIYIFPETRWWFWLMAFCALCICVFVLITYKNLHKQVVLLLTAFAFFMVSFNTSILPPMTNNHSSIRVAHFFNEYADNTDKLYSYRLRYWSLFFYAKNYGTWVQDTKNLPEIIGENNTWVYTDEYGLNEIKRNGQKVIEYGPFPFRGITKQSVNFLNPKTRNQHYQNHYLLKLVN